MSKPKTNANDKEVVKISLQDEQFALLRMAYLLKFIEKQLPELKDGNFQLLCHKVDVDWKTDGELPTNYALDVNAEIFAEIRSYIGEPVSWKDRFEELYSAMRTLINDLPGEVLISPAEGKRYILTALKGVHHNITTKKGKKNYKPMLVYLKEPKDFDPLEADMMLNLESLLESAFNLTLTSG